MPLRELRKYPNRRLYDLGRKQYVTHEDVRVLVKKRVPFVVTDSQTGRRITRDVLMQTLVETCHPLPESRLRSLICHG